MVGLVGRWWIFKVNRVIESMWYGMVQSIAFLFRFRSAYTEMATGTHMQNWLKKELQIGFERGREGGA